MMRPMILSLLWTAWLPLQASGPAEVLRVMQRVADWQLANPSAHKTTDWTQGAGYAGMMALAGISGDGKYREAMLAMGDGNQWQLGPKPYYADDHCVAQTYAELYFQHRDPKMIAALKKRFDQIITNPARTRLEFRLAGNQDRWSWCDALFMAPPAWIRLYRATGNEAYLEFMIREWDATTAYLYDKEEHLYYRDSTYFDKRESNGRKVFWGRGNGWVMGGLVRVLQYLPKNHPNRQRFENEFKAMCAKLLTCQQPDGMWRASLLDPDSYPLRETSSTGFYAYAFAWGVNQGLLDRQTYEPAARKAWHSLLGCVAEDGKLTHVQPIGADPQRFPDDSTEVYGVGALLLAGSEIYRMELMRHAAPRVVTVGNPHDFHRIDETVEIAWENAAMAPAVMDAQTSKIIDSQWVEGSLLFKVDLAPGESREYLVVAAGHLPALPAPLVRSHCRFVPERMDDFAWESDRIAHRMYGPALITGEGTVSSGIDVWVKRTRKLVVDAWYKSGDYHKDHGEGLDGYKVGPTRGCGGLGIWDGKQLFTSSNFKSYKVIANGPIRSVFELNYDAWEAKGRKVSEVKRISIDAGSNFSRVTSNFQADGDPAAPLQVGIGIANRNGGVFRSNPQKRWMLYWEPEVADHGNTGCAVIVSNGFKSFAQDQANHLVIAQVRSGEPLEYLIGAAWSGSGDFTKDVDWMTAVQREREKLGMPLKAVVVDGSR